MWFGGTNRRRPTAVAIVAALSVFVALVAGSAFRPQFSAAALPEPAAWSDGAADLAAPDFVALHSTAPVAQTHSLHTGPLRKPFHSMWMTRERPTSWTRAIPRSPSPPAPASFTAVDVRPLGAQHPTFTKPIAGQDILAMLCVARC